MESRTTSDGPSPGQFPTTRWSRVILAGGLDAPLARESLAELYNAYWYPLYAYIRRRGYGPEQAADLTQDFFARLLEKGLLSEADPTRGRFRDVAIKVLLEKHREKPEMIRRFVEEAQIAGRADPGEDRPRYLAVFERMCQTVAYAHSCGVIHRDLKPSNVMVGGFGEVQVMDWGLAKVIDRGGIADEERSRRSRADADPVRTMRTGSTVDESRAGSVLGTPSYMAPEQARGRLDTLDERADVFGLGAILCEILTGLPPYVATSGDEAYRKVVRADLDEALARLDACGAESELVTLTKSCLWVAPRDRPRDAGMVASALTAHLSGVQERLKAAELARVRAESRAAEERKRRLLVAGLAASLLALAALGGR